ncbi:MAG: redoxin domain-containing protein [Rhodanobacteraceae bacterium]|nr:MAG: redoxin domain-containing protein [Rhodanobacteraceae bacterium]
MTMQMAPAWQTTAWLNTAKPLELADLRGKVVLLHAFQMLCPGCVATALPQAKRAAQVFAGAPLVVVGLHTVFEHHAVMGAEALAAFLYEYRIAFPVGIDAPGPDGDPIPRTMRAYQMQGTPTTVLIDAEGRLRRQVFGTIDDLQLGADIGRLLAEAGPADRGFTAVGATAAGSCGPAGCAIG